MHSCAIIFDRISEGEIFIISSTKKNGTTRRRGDQAFKNMRVRKKEDRMMKQSVLLARYTKIFAIFCIRKISRRCNYLVSVNRRADRSVRDIGYSLITGFHY